MDSFIHYTYVGLKSLGLALGFVLGLLCMTVLLSSFIGAVWLQIILGLIVMIALPPFIASNYMGNFADYEQRKFVGDMFVLIWLGIAVLVLGPLFPVTKKLVRQQATRLGAIGKPLAWLGGGAAPLPKKKAKKKTKKKPLKKVKLKPRKALTRPGPMRPGARRLIPMGRPGAMLPGRRAPGSPLAPRRPGARSRAVPARPATAGPNLSAVEIFKRYKNAVVQVRAGRAMGTGFIVNKNGLVATNHHVIEDGGPLFVKLFDGTWVSTVTVFKKNAGRDLALLQIKTNKTLPVSVLGDSSKILPGERVVAIGNPLGLDHTVTDGIISQRRTWRHQRWIQISVPISKGNSGGPLINMRGEVVGVNTAVIRGGQNLNLAVPINVLKRMISGKGKAPPRPGMSTW